MLQCGIFGIAESKRPRYRLRRIWSRSGWRRQRDRQLFEKLKTLDGNELADKTKHYLSKDEVKGVMARRDKIVAQFQKLISEKGENEVLY